MAADAMPVRAADHAGGDHRAGLEVHPEREGEPQERAGDARHQGVEEQLLEGRHVLRGRRRPAIVLGRRRAHEGHAAVDGARCLTSSALAPESPDGGAHEGGRRRGAGIGGLAAAIALSRAGCDVTVVERDDTPMPADVEGAFEWDRRGAPQVRHTHGFPALIRVILRDRYPDVLAALLEAGVSEVSIMPPVVPPDAPSYERDAADLQVLSCRRTTLEWVLRRCALAEPSVRFEVGVPVDGLLVSRRGCAARRARRPARRRPRAARRRGGGQHRSAGRRARAGSPSTAWRSPRRSTPPARST